MDFQQTNTVNGSEDHNMVVLQELEQSKRALKEVQLMLEQSQAELSKLTQRNASINSHLQRVQSEFDTIPRPDIKMAYNAALDAQQRLFVMRSQLEKLQNDQTHFERLIYLLELVQKNIGKSDFSSTVSSDPKNSTVILEMIIDAQESERQRLSSQMHDGPAQALSNFIVQTEIAARLFDVDADKAKEELEKLKNSAMSTFQKVRSFIFDLRPMMLDDLGLFPTIRRYVDSFQKENSVEANLSIFGQERRLEPYQEVMIFRAVQELLRNASKHNQDNPIQLSIDVQMRIEEKTVRVTVNDNGKGFNPDTTSE
ncbi:MAG: histidine kinase, partial [Anaerolineaceae bacterium]|nr:histidine kinase [Anaerolineaceae bacterium]